MLGEPPNGIPVCRDLGDALARAGATPDYFIFGMAPASGRLSDRDRGVLLEAIDLGMNIVNGLHEFLTDDPEFVAASAARNVNILDVRKPPPREGLRTFSGRNRGGHLPAQSPFSAPIARSASGPPQPS